MAKVEGDFLGSYFMPHVADGSPVQLDAETKTVEIVTLANRIELRQLEDPEKKKKDGRVLSHFVRTLPRMPQRPIIQEYPECIFDGEFVSNGRNKDYEDRALLTGLTIFTEVCRVLSESRPSVNVIFRRGGEVVENTEDLRLPLKEDGVQPFPIKLQ